MSPLKITMKKHIVKNENKYCSKCVRLKVCKYVGGGNNLIIEFCPKREQVKEQNIKKLHKLTNGRLKNMKKYIVNNDK